MMTGGPLDFVAEIDAERGRERHHDRILFALGDV